MSNTLVDTSTFAELQAATGAEFVVELLQTFAEETPGLLSELRAARQAGDADRFRRAAHSIKSNSQTFGAIALGAAARRLELDGLHADAGFDHAAIASLQEAFEEVAVALRVLSRG